MTANLSDGERARRYLASIPAAGEGGRNQALNRAGYSIREHFPGLSLGEFEALLEAFAARMSPPLVGEEVAKTIRSAWGGAESKGTVGAKARPLIAPAGGLRHGAHRTPSPAAPAPQAPAAAPSRPAPAPTPPAKIDTAAAPPMPEPMADPTRAFLSAMFQPEEGVRIARARINDAGREVPDGEGAVQSCREWLAKLDKYGGKANALFSSDGPGLFVSVNPMKLGGSRDSDVTDFRHALLEFDEISLPEQWAILAGSRIPLAVVTYSGGKSLHGIVRVNARDRREFDERVKALYAHFAAYLPDEACRNPSRFSRLPGARRFDKRQELLAVGLGAAGWSEWAAEVQSAGIGTTVRIEDLEKFDPENDPNRLLGARWLCKGGSALLVGPSGVGKSSLTMQFACLLATGAPFFGIPVVRPLKVLVVQAENDEGDLAEMLAGVREGLNLDAEFGDESAIATLKRNLVFVRDTTHTGARFVEAAHRLIERHKPDIVFLDPLLSFVGGDISKQEVCSAFLREGLNPIAEATGCCWVCVHHTGKPPSDKTARAGWQSSDWAYSGIGSSELTNWARAALTLRQTGPGVFQLMLAKRGNRARATHPDGEPTTVIWLRHSTTGGIFWEQCQPPAGEEGEDATGAPIGAVTHAAPQEAGGGAGRGAGGSPRGKGKPGRPSTAEHTLATVDFREWVKTLPAEGLSRRAAAESLVDFLGGKGLDMGAESIRKEGGLLSLLLARGKVGKSGGNFTPPKTAEKGGDVEPF